MKTTKNKTEKHGGVSSHWAARPGDWELGEGVKLLIFFLCFPLEARPSLRALLCRGRPRLWFAGWIPGGAKSGLLKLGRRAWGSAGHPVASLYHCPHACLTAQDTQ